MFYRRHVLNLYPPSSIVLLLVLARSSPEIDHVCRFLSESGRGRQHVYCDGSVPAFGRLGILLTQDQRRAGGRLTPKFGTCRLAALSFALPPVITQTLPIPVYPQCWHDAHFSSCPRPLSLDASVPLHLPRLPWLPVSKLRLPKRSRR